MGKAEGLEPLDEGSESKGSWVFQDLTPHHIPVAHTPFTDEPEAGCLAEVSHRKWDLACLTLECELTLCHRDPKI